MASPKKSAPLQQTAPPLDSESIAAVAGGRHPQPHMVLGPHPVGARWLIRALRPLASAVTAIYPDGGTVALDHLAEGIWQGFTADGTQPYLIEASYSDGTRWLVDDPYRFEPSVGELDLYLWGQGRHEQLWKAFGAHYRVHQEARGTSFSVWAPHARAARVIGSFNDWNGVGHSMRRLSESGIWELFIPGVAPGTTYKFELLTQSGQWVERADPMARFTEQPPATASVVGVSSHDWADAEWLQSRATGQPLNSPISIYEMHLGSWQLGLGYRQLADPLVEYVRRLGFTHVEFLPLAEHPYGGSWGYQVTGYYAPTSRYGHPDDLKYLIDRLHQAGIGVILDWVPAHFPKDEWALANFDGESLYEHGDILRGEHPDWGTLVFDFGQSQVRNFLVANALYWLEEFHVDGLRVDAVASMLYLDYSRETGQWQPNRLGGRENLEAIDFLQEVNATAYKRHPGIMMIAEESTSFPGVSRPTDSGGLGFGLKWNMGWMHDTLDYFSQDPLYRSYHHNKITFSLVYAYSENFMLPISHDEVVHGKGSLLHKMPGDQWQKLANVRAFLAFMWAHPGKQLLFMGQEFGQPSEWSEQRSLDWWILDQPAHQGLSRMVGQLNEVYRAEDALWRDDFTPEGFQWLDANDAARNVVSFLRISSTGDMIAVVLNFSGIPVGEYRVGLPAAGRWDEILNTDATEFGGSGVGNLGGIQAENVPWAGRPASAELTLPPQAGLWLKLRQ